MAALGASDITMISKTPIGNSRYLLIFTITGPASLSSGGEFLTKAGAVSGLGGITLIDALICQGSGNSATSGIECRYVPVNGATNIGKFHFYNAVTGHDHDLKIIGGQGALAHVHDFTVKGGQAASTTNDVAMYSGPLIGKEQASDATVVGGAGNGGVQGNSIPKMVQMTGTDTLGKEEATTRTIVGSASATKGGVVTSPDTTVATELASTSNLSAFTFYCIGTGV